MTIQDTIFEVIGYPSIPFIIRAVAVILLIIFVKFIYTSKNSKKKRYVGSVSEIRVHPVKSAAPFLVESWDMTWLGLKHDRQYVLLNEHGTVMTLRRYPSFVLINTQVKDDHIEITAENMQKLVIPLKIEVTNDSKKQKINVFGLVTYGVHVSNEADLWFRHYFDIPGVQLFGFPSEGLPRFTADLGVKEENYQADPLMFADGCPLLLLSEETVDDLNKQCDGTNVTVGRFRPNIVVKGCKPYEEDAWGLIQIGNFVSLRCLYPCQRCVAINVDPVNGKMDSTETRLLKELQNVRPTPKNAFPKMPADIPIVGCNYGVRSPGFIKVGDPIYLIEE